MLIYQENYVRAKKEYERRKSVRTKCAEKETQIKSKINFNYLDLGEKF